MFCMSQGNIFINSCSVCHKAEIPSRRALILFNKPKQKSWNTATRKSSSTSSRTSSSIPNTNQLSFDDYVTNGIKLKAEIIWVLKSVLAGYSIRICDGLDEIFARMLPGNDIAQMLKLGRQKAMHLTSYGIKSLLHLQLAKSGIVVFFIWWEF